MFRPPSGSAMLTLFFVTLTISNPPSVRAFNTSSRVSSRPAPAIPSNPSVMAVAASSLDLGRSWGGVRACLLRGSQGSCNPSSPLMAVRHALMRLPSAAW